MSGPPSGGDTMDTYNLSLPVSTGGLGGEEAEITLSYDSVTFESKWTEEASAAVRATACEDTWWHAIPAYETNSSGHPSRPKGIRGSSKGEPFVLTIKGIRRADERALQSP